VVVWAIALLVGPTATNEIMRGLAFELAQSDLGLAPPVPTSRASPHHSAALPRSLGHSGNCFGLQGTETRSVSVSSACRPARPDYTEDASGISRRFVGECGR
jgi:hypothetical protein